MPPDPITVAEAWLRQLANRGVDFLFANSGTDFPPIVEGLARAEQIGARVPRAVIAPHENAAISMADGYARASGRAQLVMVHVNVGTANTIAGLINAERDYVPILLAAGRTPLTETGSPASRSLNIHWAQEMFDQAGMLRETVRWDYEFREAAQVAAITDRALALAHSPPRGPVYLTWPRELLAVPPGGPAGDMPLFAPVARLAPDPAAIRAAAVALAGAKRPLIITARAGSDPSVPALLGQLAERVAAPVVEYRPRYVNLSADHPLHGGYEVVPHLAHADVVLVLDCDVPWIPATDPTAAGAVVIQAGEDPLHARYPVRLFPSAITVQGSAALVIEALLAESAKADDARHDRAAAECEKLRAASRVPDALPARMTRAWISTCIDRARQPDSVLVNEYFLVRGAMRITEPGSYFGSSPAGALGWGVGAALGVKLAEPGREVIAAVGDGSYVFSNPLACHQISAAERIPTLTVIANDRGWNAVRRATLAMYPDGAASRANAMPLTRFDPVPDYAAVARACGLHGETVADPADLPHALAQALARVRDGQGALLDVLCEG